jgi:hypothetical protein
MDEEMIALRALAVTSDRFVSLAISLRREAMVVTVRNRLSLRSEERVSANHVRIGRGEGFRFGWYLEAERVDGAVVSFELEAAWQSDGWEISAQVQLLGDSPAEDVLFEIDELTVVCSEDLSGCLAAQFDALVREGRRVLES